MKKPTDEDARRAFIKDNLARHDWQGTAFAEVAEMAPALGVSWPVNREAGIDDAILFDALQAVDQTHAPDATLEMAFQAGRSVELVLLRWEMRLTRGKRKSDTNYFYALACDLVAKGSKPTDAYTKARVRIQKQRPDAAIPSRAAFKTYRHSR